MMDRSGRQAMLDETTEGKSVEGKDFSIVQITDHLLGLIH